MNAPNLIFPPNARGNKILCPISGKFVKDIQPFSDLWYLEFVNQNGLLKPIDYIQNEMYLLNIYVQLTVFQGITDSRSIKVYLADEFNNPLQFWPNNYTDFKVSEIPENYQTMNIELPNIYTSRFWLSYNNSAFSSISYTINGYKLILDDL